jgi:hypothetical protein
VERKHIIFYSGGIGSYFTARRVVEKEGNENVILLFTDTKIEDADLYRFIDETSKKLGAKLIKLQDGRTPWEVARDVRFLPNSRIAQCSHLLKQKMADAWIKKNFKPEECVLYLGIDWTEEHRRKGPTKNYKPYEVRFPMCEKPYLTKPEMLDILEKEDLIQRPRLYKMGFAHNNCGGFCFRAGIGHFKNLLEKNRELYLFHEGKEQEMRAYLGKDVSILRRTRNGQKINLTLKDLRGELECGKQLSFDELIDVGGCGCFLS